MGLMKWLGLDSGCENEPVELTEENFNGEVLESELPVIVDFWSFGCPGCNTLAPTIKRLACKYAGRIKVAQLEVSRARNVSWKLGIRSTPSVIFFKDGKEFERVVGLRGQHYFEEIIETELPDLSLAPTSNDN